MWTDVSRAMYGEIFDYRDMENLWCYVVHFMGPLYVYAYAFGELFTQSLFARRAEIGADFEGGARSRIGMGRMAASRLDTV